MKWEIKNNKMLENCTENDRHYENRVVLWHLQLGVMAFE